MKKKILALLILVALIIGGAIASAGSASASPSWRYTGTVNTYISMGDEGSIDLDTLQDHSFKEYTKTLRGMRLYKTKANTTSEYRELKAFAKHQGKRHDTPVLFCRTSKSNGFLLDLRYYYEDIKKPSKAEVRTWKGFVKKYHKANTCTLYR